MANKKVKFELTAVDKTKAAFDKVTKGLKTVGGAATSDLDAMRVNFLSERCLVTQAANNFVLFKGA